MEQCEAKERHLERLLATSDGVPSGAFAQVVEMSGCGTPYAGLAERFRDSYDAYRRQSDNVRPLEARNLDDSSTQEWKAETAIVSKFQGDLLKAVYDRHPMWRFNNATENARATWGAFATTMPQAFAALILYPVHRLISPSSYPTSNPPQKKIPVSRPGPAPRPRQ